MNDENKYDFETTGLACEKHTLVGKQFSESEITNHLSTKRNNKFVLFLSLTLSSTNLHLF